MPKVFDFADASLRPLRLAVIKLFQANLIHPTLQHSILFASHLQLATEAHRDWTVLGTQDGSL